MTPEEIITVIMQEPYDKVDRDERQEMLNKAIWDIEVLRGDVVKAKNSADEYHANYVDLCRVLKEELGLMDNVEDPAEFLRIKIGEMEQDSIRLSWLEGSIDGEFYNIDRITACIGKGFSYCRYEDWGDLRKVIDSGCDDRQQRPDTV